MINNCAGGVTPWGTWLSCEENFNGYFWGKLAGRPSRGARTTSATASARRPMPGASSTTASTSPRSRTRPNRFGWVVEIDPFDPNFVPKKRTALGRTKHEGAAGIVNQDGRYVIYLGDDERFDYVYKFVTAGKVDRAEPGRQFRPARRGHSLRRQVQRRRHAAPGCRWSTARDR